jgi:hypothetical protein
MNPSVAPSPTHYLRLACCGLLEKWRKTQVSQIQPVRVKNAEKDPKVFTLGSKLLRKESFLATFLNYFRSNLVLPIYLMKLLKI